MAIIDLPRLEDRFPTIYVTLISVLLAICLEDLVSLVREASHYDAFLWSHAAYVTGTTIAAWTGYSFIAITQHRRPRLLDSLNVFFLAIGILTINSTIDQAAHWFFLSLGIYAIAIIYAVHYNIPMLADVLPFELPFREWRWLVLIVWPFIPLGFGAAWLSYKGLMSEGTELLVAYAFLLQPVSWATLFYAYWKRWLTRAESILAAD